MKSATSSCERNGWFSPALLKKNITRFSPIWGVYTLFLFLMLPLPLFMELIQRVDRGYMTDAAGYIRGICYSAVPIGLVFGIIAAMGLFYYLMNNRSAQMIHSLPIRRDGLFWTNWVTGLLFAAVPNAVICLIALTAVLMGGGNGAGELLIFFLLLTASDLFFFSMAIFCGMFTGNILAMPVFYGIANLLAMGIQFVLMLMTSALTIGVDTNLDSRLVRWLTPVWVLVQDVEQMYDYNPEVLAARPNYLAAFLAYALIGGLALTLIALALYRRRQLERAGDLVTVGWMRPVFQWGVGICCGVVAGSLLYEAFFAYEFGAACYIILVVLWSVFFAIAARMLLNKTLKVFKTGWKGFAAMAAAVLILMVGIRTDVVGIQTYVPKAQNVERIHFNYNGNVHYHMELKEPDQIEALMAIHEAITETLDRADRQQDGGYSEDVAINGEPEWVQHSNITGLNIDYQMKDGSFVTRFYRYQIREEDLSDPDSVGSLLQNFLNRPDIAEIRHVHTMFSGDAKLEEIKAVDGYIYHWDHDGNEMTEETLEAAEAERLLDAFREDLKAGRVHVRVLWDRAAIENERDIPQCEVNLSVLVRQGRTSEGDDRVEYSTLRVPLQHSSTAVMETMKELGYDIYSWNSADSGRDESEITVTETVEVTGDSGSAEAEAVEIMENPAS